MKVRGQESLFKLGDARLAFDAKAFDYMHARAELVPDSIDVPEYDKDGTASGVIQRMIAKVSTVVTELTDSAMKLGSDRLDAALLFYTFLCFSARTGAAGAQDIHDDLKTTYPGRRTPGPRRPRPSLRRPKSAPLFRSSTVPGGPWMKEEHRGPFPEHRGRSEKRRDDAPTTIIDPKSIIDERIPVVD